MSVSVVCRGCGRRVRVPDDIDLRAARCSKCRTKLAPSPSPTPRTRPAAKAAPAPLPSSLSLTACEILSLDDQSLPPASGPAGRPPLVEAEPQAWPPLPPPFRVEARILADSGKKKLRGAAPAVLTPFGLFLESAPNRPVLFAPIGTEAEADGAVVILTYPNRVVKVELSGVPRVDRLAAETAAFLHGEGTLPDPADYHRAWWLVGIGVILGLGLAVAVVALAGAVDLNLVVRVLLGLVFGCGAAAANTALVRFVRFPAGGKVVLMGGLSFVVLIATLFGTVAFRPAGGGSLDPEKPATQPDANPSSGSEESDSSADLATLRRGPPTHLELAYRDGMSRLGDGPAAVTALAMVPGEEAVVVGHADGSTQVWRLDQGWLEPPQLGPWGRGAVRRIAFDSTGAIALLTCDGGLAAAPLNGARVPLLIPGDVIAVIPEAKRERFAAFRGGRLVVRSVPMELAKHPPTAAVGLKFLQSTPKDETIPAGVAANIPTQKPTFLAWHPAGQLLGGTADGSVVTWPTTNATSKPVTRLHKAAVRTWAIGPVWPDFATGDDKGVVAYWPNKSLAPVSFPTGGGAVTHLAFNACGGELAVTDAAGVLSVWDLTTRARLFEIKRRQPVGAVVFGPEEDILLVAEGKGVEVWWLPELAARGGSR